MHLKELAKKIRNTASQAGRTILEGLGGPINQEDLTPEIVVRENRETRAEWEAAEEKRYLNIAEQFLALPDDKRHQVVEAAEKFRRMAGEYDPNLVTFGLKNDRIVSEMQQTVSEILGPDARLYRLEQLLTGECVNEYRKRLPTVVATLREKGLMINENN